MRWVGGGMRSQGSRCRDGAESGSHGRAAQPLVEKARALAASDSELVVRVRAAEFLGLRQAADPRPIILDALGRTESGVEAALILNTVVLLSVTMVYPPPRWLIHQGISPTPSPG